MFVSKAAHQLALAEVAYLRERVGHLEEALELERYENRVAERHWSNALLRAKQSYPQQEKVEPAPKPTPTFEQLVDPGELEALTAAAKQYGFEDPEAEARRVLRKDMGLSI